MNQINDAILGDYASVGKQGKWSTDSLSVYFTLIYKRGQAVRAPVGDVLEIQHAVFIRVHSEIGYLLLNAIPQFVDVLRC